MDNTDQSERTADGETAKLNTVEDIRLEDRIRAWMGTALLACASIMAILIFADRTDAELFSMPRMWYSTRSLHLFICTTMFVFAAALLMGVTRSETAEDAPRRIFQSVRFFTRTNCVLCDKALHTLRQFEGWIGVIDIIDIDGHPDLIRQFGESVPVVEINGRIRFRGAVSPELLERLIAGTLLQQQKQSPAHDHHSAGSPESRLHQ